MSDRIVRAIIKDADLTAVCCVATQAAREARRRHGLAPSSAALLGQGLAAGLVVSSLQKAEKTRINLQIECDGPARGLFVDADTSGHARGYIRNKTVHFPSTPRFSGAPLLGRTGYVSVLRDVDGVFYRGSVGIEYSDVSRDLEHYFATSEQVETAAQLDVLAEGDEELGWVGGVLVQKLPEGDHAALERFRSRLRGGVIEETVRAGTTSAYALCEALFGRDQVDILLDTEVSYFCPCTRERVMRALSTLTNVDLAEMITQDHKAVVDCEFCGQHYEITEAELQTVLDRIDARDAAGSNDPTHN